MKNTKIKILVILLIISGIFLEYELITYSYQKGRKDYIDDNGKIEPVLYEKSKSPKYNRITYPLGTAKKPSGKVILMSIFTDEVSYTWKNSDDSEKDECLKKIKTAAEWIEENALRYGNNIEFIYNWKEDDRLIKETVFNSHIDNYDACVKCGEYIDDSIDVKSLLEDFNADSIIFLFFFNSPDVYGTSNFAIAYHDGSEYPYECCLLYSNAGKRKNDATVYAHEILHTFGTIDLYRQNPSYNLIDEAYTELKENCQDDIMDDTTHDPPREDIVRKLSDFDAYYIGWLSDLEFVDKYNLRKSDYILKSIGIGD